MSDQNWQPRRSAAQDDRIIVRVRSGPWTPVPNRLMDDARLSVPARFLYSKLRSYGRYDDPTGHPRQSTLAKNFDCSVRSIQRYLAELVQAGWILVEERRNSDGLREPNMYEVLDIPEPPVAKAAPRTVKPALNVSAGRYRPTPVSSGRDLRNVDNVRAVEDAGLRRSFPEDIAGDVSADGDQMTPVSSGRDLRNVDNSELTVLQAHQARLADQQRYSGDAGGSQATPVSSGRDLHKQGINAGRIQATPVSYKRTTTSVNHQPTTTGSAGSRPAATSGGAGGGPPGMVGGDRKSSSHADPPVGRAGSAPAELRGSSAAGRLASAVRAALPQRLGQKLASGVLRRACGPLVETGVDPKTVGAAVAARSWAGAGPGAVIAWLRDDVLDELEAVRAGAAGQDAAQVEAEFRVWAAGQPDCPHGTPGGQVPRPTVGTALCPSCRRVQAKAG